RCGSVIVAVAMCVEQVDSVPHDPPTQFAFAFLPVKLPDGEREAKQLSVPVKFPALLSIRLENAVKDQRCKAAWSLQHCPLLCADQDPSRQRAMTDASVQK